MAKLDQARWWFVRPARSRMAATYRCPLCGYRLHAMADHMLIAPEGDAEQGRLPLRDEWLATQPRPPSVWRRLRGRLR
jgi:hypothetical protein